MKHASFWIYGLLILLPACSDDKGTGLPSGDATPPGRVQDLTATITAAGDSITLAWTAPGDDGMEGQASRYEIRYSESQVDLFTWTSASVLMPPPVPSPAGILESTVARGRPTGTWYFALKAADEVPNWSSASNIASATVPDITPPGKVSNLTVTSTTSQGVTLAWTAPGDDGNEGTASEYDLRYSLASITEETWEDAILVEDTPTPASAGTAESIEVTGLEPMATYFFAIRTSDERQNWSVLSNIAEAPIASSWQLTFRPGETGYAYQSSWSPDGTQIVFSASWEGSYDLYIVPSAGGTPVRLTDDPDSDVSPAWSPLGDKIAFVSSRGDEYRKVWVMDIAPGSAPDLVVSHVGEHLSDCGWSPDGSRIVYRTGLYGQIVGPMRIFAVSAAGGLPELLISDDYFAGDPAWSPDGASIAFVSGRGYVWRIVVAPIAGGEWTRIAGGSGLGQSLRPCWSPDGSTIAYQSDRTGDKEIYSVPATGGATERLTFDPAEESYPAWSPDGSRIAFLSNRSGAYEIWIQQLR